VKERLFSLWDRAGEAAATTLTADTGVGEDAFDAARTLLAREFDAFGASAGPVAGTIPGTTWDLHAATVNGVSPPGPSFYAALARTGTGTPAAPTSEYAGTAWKSLPMWPPATDYDPDPALAAFGLPTRAFARLNAATFADLSLSHATSLLHETDVGSLSPDLAAKLKRARGGLGLIASGEGRRRPGRLTIERASANPPTWNFYLQGFAQSDGVRIVKGPDGLRCAVHGRTQGVSCGEDNLDLDGTSGLLLADLSLDYTEFGPGFSVGVEQTLASDPPATPLFLVARKPGVVGEVGDEDPGDFDVLLGIPDLSSLAPGASVTFPVTPALDQRAGEVLAPDPVRCTESQESCAGLPTNGPMPLEDELSDDNDGVESSWKHYLALARQAAEEADLLGEAVISRGLEYDQRLDEKAQLAEQLRLRAEEPIAELQRLCGTAVDPTRLLQLLSGASGDDLTGPHAGVACDTGNPCAAKYRCVGVEGASGICVADLEALTAGTPDPELDRLWQCIGGAELVPWVTLGDEPVCLWRNNARPNELCGPASAPGSGVHPCPVRKTTSGEECQPADFGFSSGSMPAGLEEISLPAEPLGFFARAAVEDDASGPNGVAKNPCEPIRRLRRLVAAPGEASSDEVETALAELVHVDALHPLRLVEALRKKVEWGAKYGGYSVVSVDGKVFASTDPGDSSPASWPCAGGEVAPDCGASGDPSLFCSTIACTPAAADDRARMNQRLFRAVVGLDWLDDDLDPRLRLPMYRTRHSALTDGDGDTWRELPQYRPVATGVRAVDVNYLRRLLEISDSDYPTPSVTFFQSDAVPPVDATLEVWRTWNGTASVPHFASKQITFKYPSASDHAFYTTECDAPQTAPNATAQFLITSPVPARKISGRRGASADMRYSILEGVSSYTRRKGHGDHLRRLLTGDSASKLAPAAYEVLEGFPARICSLDAAKAAVFYPSWQFDQTVGSAPVLPAYEATPESLLDAAELACELMENRDREEVCPDKPNVDGVRDLDDAARYVSCMGRAMEDRAGQLVIPNVPRLVMDRLAGKGGVGTFPAFGGELGTEVSSLRAALLRVATAAPEMGRQVRAFGSQIKTVHQELRILKLENVLGDLQLASQIANQAAACAAGSTGTRTIPVNPVAAVATCTNAATQSVIAILVRSVTRRINDAKKKIVLEQTADAMDAGVTELKRLGDEVEAAAADIEAKLVAIAGVRSRAFVQLSKALHAASFQSQSSVNVDAAMLSRFSTSKTRYAEALQSAKKMAFLAKRAIEIRLGERLADMREELPLVAAPHSWESSVCSLTGIDYSKSRAPQSGGADGGTGAGEEFGSGGYDFADEYIGTYVDRLERVVESYRLTRSFQDGTDTAVVSLRDDVHGVHNATDCGVESPNRLLFGEDLAAAHEDGELGWNVVGCAEVSGVPQPNCLAVARKTPSPIVEGPLGSAPAFELTFAGGGSTACTAGSNCGYQPKVALVQGVTLPAGRHRLSWYRAQATPVHAVAVLSCRNNPGLDAQGNCLVPEELPGAVRVEAVDDVGAPWPRDAIEFELGATEAIEVVVRQPVGGRGAATATGFSPTLVVGGLMLEEGVDLAPAGDRAVPTFAASGMVGQAPGANCPDLHGEMFRATRFAKGCVYLCGNGFADRCDGDHVTKHCYRDVSFSISQDDIDRGRVFARSGFARGNFNYRIESIGLNFVGSAIRDCSSSDAPQTCYAAGYVPYTLLHGGPFFVRNHAGADFEARLFPGRIEHARGLATERYLTNPLSTSDSSLIDQYMRQELQGRPLDGHFVVRVWDDEGVDFDAIEDV
ncbi:MAG: hypothetical protein FJ104_02460, partial [Deltaproteobacteria bacterium]|nr:hypothetical protein [Deltaproteobacteria bacterium]